MSRGGWVLAILTAAAAGAGGYAVGRHGIDLPWHALPGMTSSPASPSAAADKPILYYRDPDGPFYSLVPAKSPGGRDYLAVRHGEDVSFDEVAPGPEPAKAAGNERHVLYYRNPMGLPDTSPVPKKDSMGMDYIPVYEGEEEGGSTVKVSLGKMQRTGVRSEPVGRHVLARTVRAPGTVQLDERRVSVVTLRFEAHIERVGNVTTGDRVRKGQPLIEFYSPEVTSAAAQYVSVLGPMSDRIDRAALLSNGARRRLENLAVPTEVIAELERTRRVPHAMVWSAPHEGVVLERQAVEGMRASPGDVLFRLADLSVVWVLADVTERDLASLTPGQSAIVRPRSLPGRAFTGRVVQVYPQLNRETRTAPVRIELANPNGVLLPNMYADVEVAIGDPAPVLAVPDTAIIDTGTHQVVILDKGEGRFEPREVRLGRRDDNYAEVREGLSEGDKVVVAANFLIDAESNLKAALRSFTASEAPQ